MEISEYYPRDFNYMNHKDKVIDTNHVTQTNKIKLT